MNFARVFYHGTHYVSLSLSLSPHRLQIEPAPAKLGARPSFNILITLLLFVVKSKRGHQERTSVPISFPATCFWMLMIKRLPNTLPIRLPYNQQNKPAHTEGPETLSSDCEFIAT